MIAVVGDFDPRNPTHAATNRSLGELAGPGSFEWIDTDAVRSRRADVRSARGLLIAPASPYRDMDAVVDVVREAREEGVPLVGT